MTADALALGVELARALGPEAQVQTVLGGIGLYYLRRLSRDTNKALRILTGEDDVEQDDGLVGRVERIDQRSKENSNKLKRLLGGESGGSN